MPCDHTNSEDNCLSCVGKELNEKIFSEIHAFQGDDKSEDWYNATNDRLYHEVADDFLNRMSDKEAEGLIALYGIHKAMKLYKEEFGEIPITDVNVCKTFLYVILEQEYLTMSYDAYGTYCRKNRLDGWEGEEGEEGEGEDEKEEYEYQSLVINRKNGDGVFYWGATDGYLTIWRVPSDLTEEFDTNTFGNKHCLGEEWGGMSMCDGRFEIAVRTITKQMMEDEDFE
jgi:hypothetical protein